MSRRGFTLIELSVSLALTAALMVAVMGILGVVGRRCQQIGRETPDDAWREIVIGQVRWDLENSQSWQLTPDRLTLTGFAATDTVRQRTSLAACIVDYEIRAIEGRTWLVRTATETQRIDNAPPQVDLVCVGVQQFQVRIPQMDKPVDSLTGTLPRSLELQVVFEGPQRPLTIRCVR